MNMNITLYTFRKWEKRRSREIISTVNLLSLLNLDQLSLVSALFSFTKAKLSIGLK